MKRFFLVMLLMMGLLIESEARRSILTISSEFGEKIQVLVEGKVINAVPKAMVKINSLAGPKEVQINVFGKDGQLQTGHCEMLHLKSGFKSHFLLHCNEEGYLHFKRVNEKRQFSVLDYRPELLYNKRLISAAPSQPGLQTILKNRPEAFVREEQRA